MNLTIFNIKEINGSFFRFSIRFETPEGMPLIKTHGWRLAPDNSIIPPSTSWAGRNNVMAEIPTWEAQNEVIKQARALIGRGEFGKLSASKEKAKKTLVKRGPVKTSEASIDHRDFLKEGANCDSGYWLSNDNIHCRCTFSKDRVWGPHLDCPVHEYPNVDGTEVINQTSNE